MSGPASQSAHKNIPKCNSSSSDNKRGSSGNKSGSSGNKSGSSDNKSGSSGNKSGSSDNKRAAAATTRAAGAANKYYIHQPTNKLKCSALTAAVRFRASPPALREIRKAVICGMVLNASMTAVRCAGDILPSSLTQRTPARCRRHSRRSRNCVNWLKMMDFMVQAAPCPAVSSSNSASI